MKALPLFSSTAGPAAPPAARYTPLQPEEIIDILRLIRSENVGPVTFHTLVQRYGSPLKALEMLPHLSTKGGRKRALHPCRTDAAERELAAAERLGARLLVYGAPEYPSLLLHTYDPPPVLYALGDMARLNAQECLAIVGTRNASTNACRLTEMLARDLGAEDICIVSGLARGIDTRAHQGALTTGTVAVIAGGIDTRYPPENTHLYEKIIAQGVLLSEHPPGAEPLARHFPARNRIIAGMSRGVIVVEASVRSGSLVTARFAVQEGREVFAVPGFPLDPRCKGTNKLLREGATLIENAGDVLTALASQTEPRRQLGEPFLDYHSEALQALDEPEETAQDALLACLSATPMPLDTLAAASGLPLPAVMAQLLTLELAGEIERHPGGRVSLAFQRDPAIATAF